MINSREVVGTNPSEYGIIAKQTTRPVENPFLKSKKLNLERENLAREQKQISGELLKIDFFEQSNRRAKIQQINRNVEEIMNQSNFLLFERRKTLLLSEQKQYEEELLSSAISPLERAAQLREKAKQIRINRENERQAFVAEKLDQKWRSECDELRVYQSKQLQASTRHDHMRQIEDKIAAEHKRLEEEAIFANLWYQDIQAKKDKEDREAKKVYERNREVSAVLKEQMEVLEKQKEEEKRIRNENARLMHEKQNIEKLEKQLLYQKKREDQASRRHELDACVKAKLINEAKRAKEELAFDLKALEDSLISFQNEDHEKAKRKLELMEEQKIYREYLRQQYEEEKQREKELDRIINEEVEKQFQKRLAKWKAEKQARKDLLAKTVRERQVQIEEKILRNQQRERELEAEKAQINKLIDYYLQQEKQEKLNAVEKTKRYGDDLIQQMQYTSLQKKIVNEHEKEDYEKYVKAEVAYQNKLNDAINGLQMKNLNYRTNFSTGLYSRADEEFNKA